MKKHISKIIPPIAIASLVLVLVTITYVYIYIDITSIRKNTEALAINIQKETSRNRELDSIQQNIKLKLADRETVNSLFVGVDGAVDFIGQVEAIGKNNSLKTETKKIELKEDENLKSVDKSLISVTLGTRGSWSDTMKFLGQLINMPYKIAIDSVSIIYSKNTTTGQKVEDTNASNWQTEVVFNVIKTNK